MVRGLDEIYENKGIMENELKYLKVKYSALEGKVLQSAF